MNSQVYVTTLENQIRYMRYEILYPQDATVNPKSSAVNQLFMLLHSTEIEQ